MGDKHESWTLVTFSEDIFSSQDITVAVEFLTVLYGLAELGIFLPLSPFLGVGTGLVWVTIYFWIAECQGRLRKLRICLTVSRVSRLRSSYLTSLTLSGNSEARLWAASTSSIRSLQAVKGSEQWSL